MNVSLDRMLVLEGSILAGVFAGFCNNVATSNVLTWILGRFYVNPGLGLGGGNLKVEHG